jgi:predicted ATPase/DNA-binding CsgD family transcriptional regulator
MLNHPGSPTSSTESRDRFRAGNKLCGDLGEEWSTPLPLVERLIARTTVPTSEAYHQRRRAGAANMTGQRRSEHLTLPHGVTSFVGRRDAAASIRRTLEESHLVSLTGPGGVGKTRLALHVSEQVRRSFPDGVHFVELATVRDPSLVIQAIAVALNVLDQSARPPDRALIEYVSNKHVLILLDNCEHLLQACAHVVSQLLVSSPDLRVLATSREPLNISGERVYPVPPLSVPTDFSPSAAGAAGRPATHFEAVTLFEERASAVLPGFKVTAENQEAVARLCARLDGLPLAIELAAVRMRALSPSQILARLEQRFELLTQGSRNAPERHQTLRAAIAWSYALCSEQERITWMCSSVFAGEFDVDAAEYVCASDRLTQKDAFAGIAGLVDKSILARTQWGPLARYKMLETVRQFGLERLAETGSEVAIRLRHRDYYLGLAQQCDDESCSLRQLDWAERLPAERPDLFAALHFCVNEPGEARAGLRMGAALWFYWIASGFVRDGRHWLDRILAADTEPTPERARALWVDGWATILQGDNTRGIDLLNECLRTAAAVSDERSTAHANQLLGLAQIFGNDPVTAGPLLDAAIASHRRMGEWTAPALISLAQRGLAAVMVEDVDCALGLAEECRQLCTDCGERWVLSWVTYLMALTTWVTGDISATVASARDALRQKKDVNDQLGTPFCIELLAWAAVAQGAPQRAATLFGAADSMWERIGRPLFGYDGLLRWSSQNRDGARRSLGAEEFDEQVRTGVLMTADEMLRYALDESERAVSTMQLEPATDSLERLLTRREQEVAALIGQGMSNRDIATRLVISQRTAEAHVEHILVKLGFTSRLQIATWVAAVGGSPRT